MGKSVPACAEPQKQVLHLTGRQAVVWRPGQDWRMTVSHFKPFQACGLFPKRLYPKKMDAVGCAALLFSSCWNIYTPRIHRYFQYFNLEKQAAFSLVSVF